MLSLFSNISNYFTPVPIPTIHSNTSIDMGFTQFTLQDMDNMIKTLSNNSNIKNLILSHTNICGENINYIAHLLTINKNITTLKMDHTEMTSHNFSCLDAIFKNNLTLQYLDLKSNNILNEIHGVCVIDTILNYSSLTYLNISNCNLNNDFLAMICVSVNKNKSLVNFKFSGNNFNDLKIESARPIINIIQKNKTLTHLSLKNNGISNNIGYEIMRKLQINCTLKMIDLSRNRIGDDCACGIFYALCKNQTLDEIRLHYNCLTSTGIKTK